MRWRRKALIARLCARIPGGDALYKYGQSRIGNLRVDPRKRLSMQTLMCRWLADSGRRIEEGQFLEVGTGHVPVVPIGFFLAGAAQTFTIDLYRRIDWHFTRETLRWMAAHRSDLAALYTADIVATPLFDARFEMLAGAQDDPERFLELAGIRYLAPQDAASTPLPAGSIDCHFSVTVLEHIPRPVLKAILKEAQRVLKPAGVALHFIDPSDHFQHQDRSITAINFLQYSDEYWQGLAGNRFMYCNRMRASDFLALTDEAGFKVLRSESRIDESCSEALRSGFKVDARFAGYTGDDLCTTALNVMLQNPSSAKARTERPA